MAIYTLYNYHCWPIRPDIPKDKDSELFVTQFPEIVNEFNEMVDWITALNSGFQDVAKYRIKI